ncbi:MAG: 23S rRNA (guanosine2251-2'-O)-methyltransferase [Cycloclasticus pugetii]|jgi:23S rRNA (guanosine2251-2'-O)-methyltransferase|uniref:23S rRNA (guanosine-2'-O-)-methyltransferase RlmB n=2 Tax=Cycloclasticus TaxID=34067 RepID=S5TYF6_9GAMM|nr:MULTISPECIES: 23S rRNA (guanosine(2251)-2'-O)-methyltransferase RlmB [Cycloclasticus]AFT66741.1 RNA methyltransferase, TrmH family, group 3 [Cycloclasticus sp. P1]AGS40205.1 RNA methyltransferase, TrmH family [Cycloclasticus zancles 78-ME]MBV1898519.1 23S rRNA (guanosine(2251)-2'-O)-methyltransferase RlmB [Cycloclasticus sp.]
MAEVQKIHGIHAVQALIKARPDHIVNAWMDRQRKDAKLQAIKQSLDEVGIRVDYVDKKTLEKLSSNANHQGVLLTAKLPQERTEEQLKKALKEQQDQAFYLVLDQVTDPHNLGACLRTALAAGVQGVIVPKDNACRLNATVCKVASGAAELLPVYRVTNLVRTLKYLKTEGVWVSGAAGEATKDVFEAELTGSVAIVMGAEGKGLRSLTQQQCDQLIKIPMSEKVESLNVSVATGIILYEVLRQNQRSLNS